MIDLCKQGKDCGFGDLKDDLMMHVLIRGVESDRMRRRLLEDENLDLDKAIRLCQVMESTVTDLLKLAGPADESKEEVAAVVFKSRVVGGAPRENRSGTSLSTGVSQPSGRDSSNSSKEGVKRVTCSRCGRTHKPRQCPAFGQQCKKCHGRNHFARVCRTPSTQTLLVEESGESEEDVAEPHLVFQISVKRVEKKLLAQVPVLVNEQKKTMECQLDTTASCNVMSCRHFKKLGCLSSRKSH